MALADFIQQAWNKQSKWLKLLRPMSALYGYVSERRKQQYLVGKKETYTAPVPVMVIGNITVGGSGKTPLLIQLVQYLQQKGVRVGVISRGYGGKGPFPMCVTTESTAQMVGDEPALIVARTQVPMVVGPNRKQDIELLLSKYAVDFILSDDGLQHWALGRQIEWIVLDAKRGLGNEKLLPEGFLREPKSRLNDSTVIEHSTFNDCETALNMHLAVGRPYLLNPNTANNHNFSASGCMHAVVGIGYPQRFYRSLSEIGVTDIIEHAFVDHHSYTIQDLQFNDDYPVITTEKDAVKIKTLLKDQIFTRPIWVLPVNAVLSEPCYRLLKDQLASVHISI
ncbi:tetraacyldisaccharide 4'-kinase [Acinetobacter rathckeae]|uniref:tetraacyldisaccharide 4'-kinase n=1 Tax=Acinetobacter rathckeae TaxID=2605272 RepID=UPI0018A32700|nr:tetraacyldisaccharide 4'-kinase [Acinetobacter rathckeae]MBF7687650.1 tetraacyldisaccharide 4'-kinase [Acinetobacter rathckeae]MBF7695052.1 tetraacyldisaccharide 4'-kinase [Acinetobacter rathckeae]